MRRFLIQNPLTLSLDINRILHIRFFSTTAGVFLGGIAKSPFEALEDIEILRFLEASYTVDMIEVEGATIAVDVPEDVDEITRKTRSKSCLKFLAEKLDPTFRRS